MLPHRLVVLASLPLSAFALAACGTGSSVEGNSATAKITVDSSDTACTLSGVTAPAGAIDFAITNSGSQITEFYVYDQAGTTIVTEVENIGPGTTRALTASLKAGSYITSCRPNMSGQGIRAAFTVAGSSAPAASAALDKAVAEYRGYVAAESAELLTKTAAFVAALKSGDMTAAKALYPQARAHWERIEPVAESFADLDAALDARENDVAAGVQWTGWHRIEKAMWKDKSLSSMGPYAEQLLAGTKELVSRIPTIEMTPASIGNGAAALLEEVAVAKVTGEEERYSRTDLWDFQANVDGAHQAFLALEPALVAKDPALAADIKARFGAMFAELWIHKGAAGFVSYDVLTKAQIRTLVDRVDALSEPLSQMTSAVVK